jgi:DNA-directed RNA polymerase specialized sigma24 family protein
LDARKARVIELRVFAGLEFQEIGALLEVSRATLDRDFPRRPRLALPRAGRTEGRGER